MMRRLLDHPWFVLLCLVVATALRVTWVLLLPPPALTGDFAWYLARATTLAAGQGYTIHGVPTAYFPPAYPALLAGFFHFTGPSLIAVQLVNVALQAATLALLYRTAKTLTGSEPAARVALLLAALHPNAIAYASLPAGEHLFVPLMLAGVSLLWQTLQSSLPAPGRVGERLCDALPAPGRTAERYRGLILAGLLFAAATLTRPQGLLLPGLLCLLALLPALRTRAVGRWVVMAVTVHLVMAVGLAPWVLRNARVFGQPLLTTVGGINLYLGNNPQANGTYRLTPALQAIFTTVAGEVAQDAACHRAAVRYLRAHPGQALARLPAKLRALYLDDTDGIQPLRQVARGPWAMVVSGWVLCAQGYYLAVLAGFLLALPSALRRGPPVGLAIIAAFTLLYLLYYGMSRYHQPMLPWMMLECAWWLTTMRREPLKNDGTKR